MVTSSSFLEPLKIYIIINFRACRGTHKLVRAFILIIIKKRNLDKIVILFLFLLHEYVDTNKIVILLFLRSEHLGPTLEVVGFLFSC